MEFSALAAARLHANAARLPLPGSQCEEYTDAKMLLCLQIDSIPIKSGHTQRAMQADKDLQKVMRFTRNGWPESVPAVYKPYFNKRNKLSVEAQCLMWGIRVVIPMPLREALLQELHHDHPDVSKMKALARSHLWWLNVDKDIEAPAKSCQSCQEAKQAPPKAPLHPWTWPIQPWQRVRIDYAGPFMGENFFLAIDAHSKRGEVYKISSTTTSKTIECLRQMFVAYGLPHQIVSDNGSQFTSDEFSSFMKANGIKNTRTTPYHPTSNG